MTPGEKWDRSASLGLEAVWAAPSALTVALVHWKVPALFVWSPLAAFILLYKVVPWVDAKSGEGLQTPSPIDDPYLASRGPSIIVVREALVAGVLNLVYEAHGLRWGVVFGICLVVGFVRAMLLGTLLERIGDRPSE